MVGYIIPHSSDNVEKKKSKKAPVEKDKAKGKQ